MRHMTSTRGFSSDPRWWDKADCLGYSPELWFAEDTRKARAICATCPVRGDCLLDALNDTWRVGIFGGTDEVERRKLRRQARAAS